MYPTFVPHFVPHWGTYFLVPHFYMLFTFQKHYFVSMVISLLSICFYVQCSTPSSLPYFHFKNITMLISLLTFDGPEKDLNLNYTHCFIYIYKVYFTELYYKHIIYKVIFTLFDPKCTFELERNLLTLLLIFDIPMIGFLTFYIDFQRAMNIHIL